MHYSKIDWNSDIFNVGTINRLEYTFLKFKPVFAISKGIFHVVPGLVTTTQNWGESDVGFPVS